jgi:hypothetical protein
MQVEEVALRKYGDVEAIRDARQERLQVMKQRLPPMRLVTAAAASLHPAAL